jgi:aspartokinase-like uncharacterized kinase
VIDAWVIVKVGGSLYDLPDLGPRLRAWLAQLNAEKVLLVPGGGLAADVIRTLDHVHRLGEETSHWLALQALSLNARFLLELLPEARLLQDPAAVVPGLFIVDAYPFFRADEVCVDHLPRTWNITSDSLALRAAVLLQARELILLKSTDWHGNDWAAASRAKVVDTGFADTLRQAPTALRIRFVNWRAWAIASAGSTDTHSSARRGSRG